MTQRQLAFDDEPEPPPVPVESNWYGDWQPEPPPPNPPLTPEHYEAAKGLKFEELALDQADIFDWSVPEMLLWHKWKVEEPK
jgi:hypothetical protein